MGGRGMFRWVGSDSTRRRFPCNSPPRWARGEPWPGLRRCTLCCLPRRRVGMVCVCGGGDVCVWCGLVVESVRVCVVGGGGGRGPHQGVPSRPRSVRGRLSGSKNTASPKSIAFSGESSSSVSSMKLPAVSPWCWARLCVCECVCCVRAGAQSCMCVLGGEAAGHVVKQLAAAEAGFLICPNRPRALRKVAPGLLEPGAPGGAARRPTRLDVAVQDAVGVALRQGVQHAAHVACHLRGRRDDGAT